MALGFVLAYWQVFLIAGLLILAIVAVVYALLQQNHRQLQSLVADADRRVDQALRVEVRCCTLTTNGKTLGTEEVCISLSPPAERLQLRSASGVANWLRGGAIPQLQQANRNAGEMLRKLHDFLSVPKGIRPLNLDFDQLFNPQRFSALEQSFSEVVLLNDAFRQLSEERLA